LFHVCQVVNVAVMRSSKKTANAASLHSGRGIPASGSAWRQSV
jgi:hypothetical protein